MGTRLFRGIYDEPHPRTPPLTVQLRTNVPHAQIPPLPTKFLVPWANPEETAHARFTALETILHAVRGSAELFDLWQVRNFHGMDTHSDDAEAPPLSTAAGILYVNVMECRNLPLRDASSNKPPSAFCEIQIASSVLAETLPAAAAADGVKTTEIFPDSRGPRVRCLCRIRNLV